MNLLLKLSIIILLITPPVYSQVKQSHIYKCAKSRIKSDSCIYLRDFNSKLSGTKAVKNWRVRLNSGTSYFFELCGCRKLEKLAPNAAIKLFHPKDSTFLIPLKKANIGSGFTFQCYEDGEYYVTIGTPTPVKYGAAVGVLYFKGKFKP